MKGLKVLEKKSGQVWLPTDNLCKLLDALTVGLTRERGTRREEAGEDILWTVHQCVHALRFLEIIENSGIDLTPRIIISALSMKKSYLYSPWSLALFTDWRARGMKRRIFHSESPSSELCMQKRKMEKNRFYFRPGNCNYSPELRASFRHQGSIWFPHRQPWRESARVPWDPQRCQRLEFISWY